MRKDYERPIVAVYGTVRQITRASLDSDREDRIFNAQGHHADSATGSLDQCFFVPDDSPNCNWAD